MNGLTLIVLVALFGAYELIDGVVAVGVVLQERGLVGHWWVFLLEGLASIFLGVLTFLWPAITAFALLYLIAAWAISVCLFQVCANGIRPNHSYRLQLDWERSRSQTAITWHLFLTIILELILPQMRSSRKGSLPVPVHPKCSP